MNPSRTLTSLFKAAALALLLVQGLRSQDSTAVRDSSSAGFLPLPILFYAPENGVGIGGVLIYVTREKGAYRPSTWSGQAIFTSKKQIVLEGATETYSSDGDYRTEAGLHYSDYPQKFFGIGNNIPEGRGEQFISRTFRARLDVVRRLSEHIRLGGSSFYESKRITEKDPAKQLATGTIPGSDGGVTAGLGVLGMWDSRDNIFSSYSGTYHRASLRFFSPTFGSDFDYSVFFLDSRAFIELARDQILAFQGMGIAINGTAPFHKMAELGGSNLMRGYFQGRYNDKNLLAVQGEYRFPVWNIVSAAAFAAAGDVASELRVFNLPDVKFTGGVGLRFTIQEHERLVLRVDFGFSRHDSGVYLAGGQAF